MMMIMIKKMISELHRNVCLSINDSQTAELKYKL